MMVFVIEKFLADSGSQIAHIACRCDIVAEIWQCLRLFFGTSGNFFFLLWQFCTFSGNLVLPPPSSRAISFTISISAAAAKTGNKSKVIKAVAQRQERGGEEEGTKL